MSLYLGGFVIGKIIIFILDFLESGEGGGGWEDYNHIFLVLLISSKVPNRLT